MLFVFGGILLLSLSVIRYLTDFIDIRLLIFLPVFILSIVSGRFKLHVDIERVNLRIILLLAIFGMILFFGGGWIRDDSTKAFFLSAITLVGILPVWFLFRCFGSAAQSNMLQNLAYVSFCMFLFHRIIYRIALQIFRPSTDLGIVLVLVLIGLPVLYIFSLFIQKAYDRLVLGVVS
jgi:hypothetical protein